MNVPSSAPITRPTPKEFAAFESYPDFTHLDPASIEPLVKEMYLDPAQVVVDYYAHKVGVIREIDHPEAVVDILHDFFSEIVPYPLYQAALMHDLSDRTSDLVFSRRAKEALGSFFNNPVVDERVKDYVASRLADQPVIKKFVDEQRYKYANQFKESNPELRNALAQPKYKKKLDPEVWTVPSGHFDVLAVEELFRGVNISSGLLAAAEALHNISQPPGREAKLLQYVHDIESFYAPFVEILGFTGFASALRAQTASVRLRMSGNTEYLYQAKNLVAPLRDKDSVDTVGKVLFGEEFAVSSLVGRRSSTHSTLVGDWVAAINGILAAGGFRGKTAESAALKYNRKTPRDVLGLTSIADDDEGAIFLLGSVIKRAQNDTGFRLTPNRTPTESAIDIRGDDAFVDYYLRELGQMGVNLVKGIDTSEPHPDKPKHRFAKFMLYVTTEGPVGTMPTELISTTKDARVSDLRGPTAHFLYDKKEPGSSGVLMNDGAEESLGSLYERRANIRPDVLRVIPESLNRGKLLRSRVKNYQFSD